MPPTIEILNGVRILVMPPDGAKLKTAADAVEIVAEAATYRAGIVVIPVERLDGDFFQLATRVAGEIVQKFVNYRIHIAILGEVSEHVGRSAAFRDFVVESNRGTYLWFLDDLSQLEARLKLPPQPPIDSRASE
ncbi:MAG: DUF4180 domain-containing protein [Bryobacteraceae bacterium]